MTTKINWHLARTEMKATALPATLAGLHVLDVGGFDGHMARLCLDRDAASAIVVDNQQYQQYDGYVRHEQDGVEYEDADFMEWRPPFSPFDVVLCFDVIYHLKSPYEFAEKLYAVTKSLLCFSTRTQAGQGDGWRLYSPREGHTNDPTVFWKPTQDGIMKLLSIVGFKVDLITYQDLPGMFEPDGFLVGRWRK